MRRKMMEKTTRCIGTDFSYFLKGSRAERQLRTEVDFKVVGEPPMWKWTTSLNLKKEGVLPLYPSFSRERSYEKK